MGEKKRQKTKLLKNINHMPTESQVWRDRDSSSDIKQQQWQSMQIIDCRHEDCHYFKKGRKQKQTKNGNLFFMFSSPRSLHIFVVNGWPLCNKKFVCFHWIAHFDPAPVSISLRISIFRITDRQTHTHQIKVAHRISDGKKTKEMAYLISAAVGGWLLLGSTDVGRRRLLPLPEEVDYLEVNWSSWVPGPRQMWGGWQSSVDYRWNPMNWNQEQILVFCPSQAFPSCPDLERDGTLLSVRQSWTIMLAWTRRFHSASRWIWKRIVRNEATGIVSRSPSIRRPPSSETDDDASFRSWNRLHISMVGRLPLPLLQTMFHDRNIRYAWNI